MIFQTSTKPSIQSGGGPMPTDVPGREEPILLVHGTFANKQHDGALDWWRPGSGYCLELDAHLKAAGSAARCWSHLAAGTDPFAWSGANSEKDRLESGRALAEQIAALEANRDIHRYHLVCHSHGGNVLVNALSGLQAVPTKLGGVVFMGTPFLRFRHRSEFDIRLVSIPLFMGLFGYSLWAAIRPSEHHWFWALTAATLLASLLAEAFLSRRLRAHGSPNLYGSGTACAFVFDGDEAIAALNIAQGIAKSPRRFVRQFMSNEKPGSVAIPSSLASPRGLFDRLRDSGIYVLIDELQQWLGSDDPILPPLRSSTRQAVGSRPGWVESPTSMATDSTQRLRQYIQWLLSAIPVAKSYASSVLALLFALVLVPRLLVAIVVFPISLTGRLLSFSKRKLLTKLAEIGTTLSLPGILRKGVFGTDAGEFLSVHDLPPGVNQHELITPELQGELAALRSRLASKAGGSIFSAMDADDAFGIKSQVEHALTDVNLVHSHYYQSAPVIGATAQLIARCNPSVPRPPAPGPGSHHSWKI